MNYRASGKNLIFLDLVGDGEKIQVMAQSDHFDGANDNMTALAAKAGEEPFNFKLGHIKRGDIIGVRSCEYSTLNSCMHIPILTSVI